MDKTFYIFLDIDGVLYDWTFLKKEMDSARIKKGTILKHFKPEAVNALNHLIKELSTHYKVNLVISSTWRRNLLITEVLLRKNGLKYDGVITSTPISPTPQKRGLEILQYLNNKQSYDFVIIDDELFDYEQYFNNSKIIKTNIHTTALSMNMVNDFLQTKLSNNKCSISEK